MAKATIAKLMIIIVICALIFAGAKNVYNHSFCYDVGKLRVLGVDYDNFVISIEVK